MSSTEHTNAGDGTGTARHGPGEGAGPGALGLAVADGGYALELDRTHFEATPEATLRFRISDDRGRVVRDAFRATHEKRLHMIVVRRDTSVFRHVHPEQQPDGGWVVDTALAEPGVFRVYADFAIDGEHHTLSADLFVSGDFRAEPLPAPAGTARAVDEDGSSADGIDVALGASGLRAGRQAPLTFAVTQGGRPLRAFEPYLGAKGHLVALREGDLAYLHVHPADGGGGHHAEADGAAQLAHETTFAATFPTAGRYRLFLQFQVAGRVRTVDFTLDVPR